MKILVSIAIVIGAACSATQVASAAKPVTPQFAIYPSAEARTADELMRTPKAADVDKKAAQKAADTSRQVDEKSFKQLLASAKETYKDLSGFRFDERSLRIEADYNYNQLTELYPLIKLTAANWIPNSIKEKNPGGQPRDLFLIAYATPEAVNQFINETRDLDNAALAALKAIRFADYDKKMGSQLELIGLGIQTQKDADICSFLLGKEKGQQNLDGIVVGENHGDQGPKDFIANNLQSLKASGVDTIYLEQLRTEYQPSIDDFLKSSKPMTEPLAQFIKSQKLMGILESARKQKVRVRALDTIYASRDALGGLEGRVRRMNYFASQQINSDPGRKQKYVVLAGEAHCHTHANSTAGAPGYAGLVQLLCLAQGAKGAKQGTVAIKVNEADGKISLITENRANR